MVLVKLLKYQGPVQRLVQGEYLH